MDKHTIKVLTKHCFQVLTESTDLEEGGWLHRIDLEAQLQLTHPETLAPELLQGLWDSFAEDGRFELKYGQMIRATFGHEHLTYPICEQPPALLYFVFPKRETLKALHHGVDQLLRLYDDPIRALDETSFRKYLLCVAPTEDLMVLSFAGNYFVDYLPANSFTYHAKETFMPLYDYVCPECDHTFEKLKSFDERKDAQPCPKCSCEECERQLATFSIKYKGEGFYTTDYRKKSFE